MYQLSTNFGHGFDSRRLHHMEGSYSWFSTAVLKTAEPKGSVGSNPTPSAICKHSSVG